MPYHYRKYGTERGDGERNKGRVNQKAIGREMIERQRQIERDTIKERHREQGTKIYHRTLSVQSVLRDLNDHEAEHLWYRRAKPRALNEMSAPC